MTERLTVIVNMLGDIGSDPMDIPVKCIIACPIYLEQVNKEDPAQNHEAVVQQNSKTIKTYPKYLLNFNGYYDL